MGFLYLFISILSESAAKTVDKLNFRRNRITSRQLMLLIFFVMSVSSLLFIVLTQQTAPRITAVSVGLLVLIAAFSFGGNVFDYLSLKADDLSLREPLVDFQPILAGLVGYVLFPAERKHAFLVAFVLGTFIVRWGIHRRKLRKFQKKGMFYLLICVALYAALPALYKETLAYAAPAYISFFRVTAVLVLTSIFFPVKKMKGFTPKKVGYSLVAGVIYAVGSIASLYAIKVYGVVLTMLFTMLGPALRYLSGYFVLKEKVRRGEVISSFLLTLVVVVAAIVR